VGNDQTRRELMLAGAAAAGVALTTPAAAAAAGSRSQPPPESDTDRVRRLLSVELLLLFCYRHVLGSALLRPVARRALLPLRAHEEAHIRALGRALRARGGTAPPSPPSVAAANRDLAHRNVGGRLGQLRGPEDAVLLLLSLERVTIGAYFVALTKLENRPLIVLAAEIMANDAQHEAILGEQLPKATPGSAVPYGLIQGVQ
jgi:hypothetical protein